MVSSQTFPVALISRIFRPEVPNSVPRVAKYAMAVCSLVTHDVLPEAILELDQCPQDLVDALEGHRCGDWFREQSNTMFALPVSTSVQ